MKFKVWVEIEKIGDETKDEYENVGQYELAKFDTQEQAENFVSVDLTLVRAINEKLQNACKEGLKFLEKFAQADQSTEIQARQTLQIIFEDALNPATLGTALPATELLTACEVLTSYVMDLLYRLDNQVCLDDVEELQQARQAIDRYKSDVAKKRNEIF